ncbi:MAG: hypothetical protein HY774_21815 [Acidobacteria bacterium]|nr:hypothetical protein [Acidobacteriota bacterium]
MAVTRIVLVCLVGFFTGAACQLPSAAPKNPATPPNQSNQIDLFIYLDQFLPQFSGKLAASTPGKTAFLRQEAEQILKGARVLQPWKPAAPPETTEDTFKAKIPDLTLGNSHYQCEVTLRTAPGNQTLLGTTFTLASIDGQEIAETVDNFSEIVTKHYGEPTLTYEDAEGAEWLFANGKLVLLIERGNDGNTLSGVKSRITFRFDPLSPDDQVPGEITDRDRD